MSDETEVVTEEDGEGTTYPSGAALDQAFKQGANQVHFRELGNLPVVVAPDHVHVRTFEGYRPGRRPIEPVDSQVHTAAALDELVNVTGSFETVIVYADSSAHRVTAVLDARTNPNDFNKGFTAGHQVRRATLQLVQTAFFQALLRDKWMNQRELLDFVLDWGPELDSPRDLDLLPTLEQLAVATGIENIGTETGADRARQRTIKMSLTTRKGTGEEALKTRWTWKAPLYVGAEPMMITTRLMFDENGRFNLRLLSAEAVKEDAFSAVVEAIKTVPLVRGAPPPQDDA